MSTTVVKDFKLRLAWIECGKNSPGQYVTVFELKDPSNTNHAYVKFRFNFFELMCLYLKNLEKAYGLCSVNQLMNSELPVKVEYFSTFAYPPVFKTLYIKSNKIWPSEDAKGFFIYDD